MDNFKFNTVEEAIEAKRVWRRALLPRGKEEVAESSKGIEISRALNKTPKTAGRLLSEVRLRRALALEVFRVQPRRVEERIRQT